MITIPSLAFLFGISQKLADLIDSNIYINPIFLYIFGSLWSFFGSLLILNNTLSAVIITATVLYWLSNHKLDQINHTIAGTIVLIVALFKFQQYSSIFLIHVVLLLLWYFFFGTLSKLMKKKSPNSTLLRLRLWIYLGPFTYSLIVNNWTPFTTAFFGMMGTEITTCYCNKFIYKNSMNKA